VNVLPVTVSNDRCEEADDSHHDLKTVEALGLGTLHLGRETLDQVFVDDTIRLIISMRLLKVTRRLTAAKKAKTCSIK
jgi:hypothetical protein